MTRVEVRGVVVRGVELDGDVAGSGRTLVWGHGLTSSREGDDALGLLDHAALAGAARVVRYDARGHGTSGATDDPAGYSWRELALDQLALADAFGVEAYVAGGASMGCGTALHAAVLAPERIEALLLLIPPTAWETRAERVEIWGQMAGLVEANGVGALVAASAAVPPPDPFAQDPAWRDTMTQRTLAADPGRLARVYRGAGTADLPGRDDLRRIRVPALILAWTGDPAHPADTAEQLAELLPSAELHVASTAAELSTWTARSLAFLAGG